MNEPQTELWVMRHGETAWNQERRIQGIHDSSLSEHGRQQIAQLARSLSGTRFTALYSSDLTRAVHTAEAVNHYHQHQICLDPRLRERNFGDFQGLTHAEIGERFPAHYQTYLSMDPDFVMPGGQSRRQLQQAVQSFMADVLDRHYGQRVAAIAHGGSIECMGHSVLGIPLDTEWPLPCHNASVCVFEFEVGRWILRRWGTTAHVLSAAAAE